MRWPRSCLHNYVGTRISVNSLSKISDRIQTLGKGEGLNQIALIASIVLCSFFIADLFAVLFEKYLPSPPVSMLANRRSNGAQASSMMDYEVIANRNLFSSKLPKKDPNAIDLDADPVPTTLPLQLIGTVIFEKAERSMATLQDKSESKVYPMRPGDEVEGKFQVLTVEARRVVFINFSAKRKEFVELPEDPNQRISYTPSKSAAKANIAEVAENKFVVKRDEINKQLANYNTLLTQALAVPENQGGVMIGFRLQQIQKGSFYEKIGLKQNDVISSVNGEKITDVAKALTLLQDLKSIHSLDLGLIRNGKEVNLNYDIQ